MSEVFIPALSAEGADALAGLTDAMRDAGERGEVVPCSTRPDEFVGGDVDPEAGRACATCPMAVFAACEAWGRASRWPGIYAGEVVRPVKRTRIAA